MLYFCVGVVYGGVMNDQATATTVTTTIGTDVAQCLVGMVATRDEKGRYVIDGVAYWMLDEALGVALGTIADEAAKA